jgi:hypothetical protein
LAVEASVGRFRIIRTCRNAERHVPAGKQKPAEPPARKGIPHLAMPARTGVKRRPDRALKSGDRPETNHKQGTRAL